MPFFVFLAPRRYPILSKELLPLDGFPVLDAAKVADDHYLIESANLLIQPPDLRNHLLRGSRETQFFFDALVIGESPGPFRHPAGIEAIAGGE